jgi:hypothetical protein
MRVNRQLRGTPFSEGSGPHAVQQAQRRAWTAQGPSDLLTEAFDAPAVIRMLAAAARTSSRPNTDMGRVDAGELWASATENWALTGSA